MSFDFDQRLTTRGTGGRDLHLARCKHGIGTEAGVGEEDVDAVVLDEGEAGDFVEGGLQGETGEGSIVSEEPKAGRLERRSRSSP